MLCKPNGWVSVASQTICLQHLSRTSHQKSRNSAKTVPSSHQCWANRRNTRGLLTFYRSLMGEVCGRLRSVVAKEFGIFNWIRFILSQLEFLGNIGGDSTVQCTRAFMSTLFSEEFSAHLNWCGGGSKQPLFNNRLCHLTTDSVAF